jgi:hypothetical protein
MTSYKLGVVALAMMGVWFIAGGLSEIEFLVRSVEGGGGPMTFAAILMLTHMGIGAALLFGRERLAGVMLPRDEEDSDGAPLDDLVLSGLMIAGVCLFVGGAWRVLRMIVPVAFYGDQHAAPWTQLAPDLLTMSVALLVFLRPEWVLGLWRRSRTGGAT